VPAKALFEPEACFAEDLVVESPAIVYHDDDASAGPERAAGAI
jgi:hypothetical protein